MDTDSPNSRLPDTSGLRGSENGQTTVEYALITALVIALAVVSFTALSSSILTFFTNLVAQVGAIGS